MTVASSAVAALLLSSDALVEYVTNPRELGGGKPAVADEVHEQRLGRAAKDGVGNAGERAASRRLSADARPISERAAFFDVIDAALVF